MMSKLATGNMFDPKKSLAQHVMTCRWMTDIVEKSKTTKP